MISPSKGTMAIGRLDRRSKGHMGLQNDERNH
jgi:16S rRNA U516 pseudouridylate synthase RsuA-like enzyme